MLFRYTRKLLLIAAVAGLAGPQIVAAQAVPNVEAPTASASPPASLTASASRGDPRGMVRLGRWYLAADNDDAALDWFEQAAGKDYLEAMLSLYDIYGLELRARAGSQQEARWWLDAAKDNLREKARRGDLAAQLRLAQVCERDPDDTEALAWYRAAAKAGSAEAMYQLSVRYRIPWGVPEDRAESMHWLKLAAEHGHPKAIQELADDYAKGAGVPQDAVQAHLWQGRADAARGAPQAVRDADSVWDYPPSPDINGRPGG